MTDAYTAYTPTWSASSSPSIGNGALHGFYRQWGKHVEGYIGLTTGSSTSVGTGQWAFGLPVGAAQRSSTVSPVNPALNGRPIGFWQATNQDGGGAGVPQFHQGLIRLISSFGIALYYQANGAVGQTFVGGVSGAAPFAIEVAEADEWAVWFQYEAA